MRNIGRLLDRRDITAPLRTAGQCWTAIFAQAAAPCRRQSPANPWMHRVAYGRNGSRPSRKMSSSSPQTYYHRMEYSKHIGSHELKITVLSAVRTSSKRISYPMVTFALATFESLVKYWLSSSSPPHKSSHFCRSVCFGRVKCRINWPVVNKITKITVADPP